MVVKELPPESIDALCEVCDLRRGWHGYLGEIFHNTTAWQWWHHKGRLSRDGADHYNPGRLKPPNLIASAWTESVSIEGTPRTLRSLPSQEIRVRCLNNHRLAVAPDQLDKLVLEAIRTGRSSVRIPERAVDRV